MYSTYFLAFAPRSTLHTRLRGVVWWCDWHPVVHVADARWGEEGAAAGTATTIIMKKRRQR